MKLKNPRIERLKQLMSLEERRAHLQYEIDALTAQMTTLKDALFEESNQEALGNPVAAARPVTVERAAKTSGGQGRMRRGALRDRILTALEVGGQAGIKVTDLAKAIGIKPVNVYSWFHSATKRYPQIKKLDGGHYRLDGKIERSNEISRGTGEQRTATSNVRGLRRRGQNTQRSRRGELTQRILNELGQAGTKGISVRDLASRVGAPYKNIYIWFATTGKKNGNVEKVTPGYYRLGA